MKKTLQEEKDRMIDLMKKTSSIVEQIPGPTLYEPEDAYVEPKDSSINEIKDEKDFSPEQKEKISTFVTNYKGDFKDEDIHKLSDEMGLETPEVEEFIYNMARMKNMTQGFK